MLNPNLIGFLQSFEDIFSTARRVSSVISILEKPSSVRFIVITHRNPTTQGLIKMPQSLLNDQIANIPLEFDNLVGQKVSPPSAGTITLTLTNTADGTPFTGATAAMGADGTSVDVTPVPADGTNTSAFTLAFEDVANADLKASLDCNFTSDPNAANVHFVTTGVTERPVGP